MEKEKFDSIIYDQKSIKFGEWSGQHFLFEKESLVIGFSFMHRGYPNHIGSNPEARIMLSVFPLSNLSVDIPLKPINESTLIVVNAENYDYAMTFRLKIDLTNHKSASKD